MNKGAGIIAIILIYTYLFASTSVRPYSTVDIWPLGDIWIQLIVAMTLILIIAYKIFKNYFGYFYLILIPPLIVFLPIMKYNNPINIYNPYDSAAFYSYGMSILVNGQIIQTMNLYYVREYGFHSSIVIIPAILSLATDVKFSISMNIILTAVYILYWLFLILTLRIALKKYILNLHIVALIVLFTVFPPSYGGIPFSYGFISILVYYLYRIFINEKNIASKLVFLIVSIALFTSHYSTSIILLIYLLFILFGNLLYKNTKNIILFITLFVIFIFYEIFFDIYLASGTLSYAFKVLSHLYIYELKTAQRAIENYNIPLVLLIQFLISSYFKLIIFLVGIFISFIFFLVIFLRNRNNVFPTYLLLLYLFSLPLWVVGWAGVGKFLSGGRAIHIINIFLIIFYVYLIEYYLNLTRKKVLFLFSYILIILGIITNFGLPFSPAIELYGTKFIIPIYQQQAITQWPIFALTFISQNSPDYPFLCANPYISFGLCDLLWGKQRIPSIGSISVPLFPLQSQIAWLEKWENVLIPFPTGSNVVVGPLNCDLCYNIAYSYLVVNSRGLIYNIPHYVLFYK
ncbi:MAG: hypothetical protein ACP5IB_07460 [Thermoplasmata archaeon]